MYDANDAREKELTRIRKEIIRTTREILRLTRESRQAHGPRRPSGAPQAAR